MKLHEWQTLAFEKWKEKTKTDPDFLLVAAVGAGKTFESCYIAMDFLQEFLQLSEKRKVIVITNSLNLVHTWAESANELNIQLKECDNAALEGGLPSDVHGYVTTYHSLGSWPELHESICSRYECLVVLDEVHHLEENSEDKEASSVWCQAAQQAFKTAAYRLLLSGTPFRSSGNRIPYVKYKEVDGETVVDPSYSYSYGEAVLDHVCRQVKFHPYGCKDIAQIEYRHEGQDFSFTFEDEVDNPHPSKRLWAFNNPSQNPDNLLLTKMLLGANDCLDDLRRGDDTNAGGLIIANSKKHAEILREFFFQKTGIRAEMVTSDDIGAQVKLRRFKEGNKDWLIAVRMVTEGVDIPRLRVLVYCSQITEELFFIQAMGRIVRVAHRSDDGRRPGLAHMFMPADQRFTDIAATVEDEVNRALSGEEERRRQVQGEGAGNGEEGSQWEFIGADGGEEQSIVGGAIFEAWVMERAQALQRSNPIFEGMDLIKVCEHIESLQEPSDSKIRRKATTKTYSQINNELRGLASKRHRAFCKRSGRDYAEVWNEVKARLGIDVSKRIEQLSNPDLEKINLEFLRLTDGLTGSR